MKLVEKISLTFLHEEGVEHCDSLAEHCDLKLVFRLEVFHELLHGHLSAVLLHRVYLEPRKGGLIEKRFTIP